MKQKVGIITLHYVDNYGGVLLVYGLQEKIRELGYEPVIIDYDPTPIPSLARYLLSVIWRRLVSIPKYVIKAPMYFSKLVRGSPIMPPRHMHKSTGRRADKFSAFRKKRLVMSSVQWQSAGALEKFPPALDCCVCGSDQIWNPYMCRPDNNPGLDPAYFLSFIGHNRRVSYAPSISIPRIPEHLEREFSSLVGGVKYLSCREEAGAQLITKLIGKSVKVVLDPALLLDAKKWELIAAPKPEKPYILCYFLGDGGHYRKFAKILADKKKLPIKIVSSRAEDAGELCAEMYGDVGPEEFLSLIAGASYVCTDSFHGTLFSITFSRLFYVFERPGSSGKESMSSRIHSILERLGLKDRLVRDGVLSGIGDDFIDYAAVHNRLSKLREDSVLYLRDSLLSATSGE